MARGGARNRSGPQPDPGSERSERRGLTLMALPVEGYSGRVPRWPKPKLVDGEGVESSLSARARGLWREAWKYPQAAAWAGESWRWPILAEYCLLMAAVEESPGKSAALVGQLHRFRDQLGLTPAGLRENGWQIGEVKAQVKPSFSDGGLVGGSRARLRAVGQ